MCFDREEGIILLLDKGYILISRGLLPPLEEGHIRSNGVEQAVADRCRFVCIIIMWVWHISRMRIKILASRGMACVGRGRPRLHWEANGVILNCCRCITGVSCTKVLHLFNEAQIFGNLFVAHTIIEPLYDRRYHQHIYTSP